jgi:hypothetical protein
MAQPSAGVTLNSRHRNQRGFGLRFHQESRCSNALPHHLLSILLLANGLTRATIPQSCFAGGKLTLLSRHFDIPSIFRLGLASGA